MKLLRFCRIACLSPLLALAAAQAWAETTQAQARDALAAAEQAVAEAAAQRALWIGAEDALRRARQALAAGDTDRAAALARIASEQAALGLAQKQYPMTSAGDR